MRAPALAAGDRKLDAGAVAVHRPSATLRLAEVLTALSLASDLGHDQPLEKSLRTTLIATRLAEAMGLVGTDLSAVYYVALLRSIGCTANSHETAILVGGDERVMMGLVQALAGGDAMVLARGAARLVEDTAPELASRRSVAWFLKEARVHGRLARDSACEVSRALAARLGLPTEVQTGLDQVYERWDGKGPAGIAGEALGLPARVTHVADVVEIAFRTAGVAAARDVTQSRRGGHFDPAVCAVALGCLDDVLAGLDDGDVLEAALDAEPAARLRCERSRLEDLGRAIADFTDMKSPWTLGHSRSVARLAAAAVAPDLREATNLAGLVHDIGRVAVPNTVWDKRGRLGAAAWERVRLHPYYTERVLSRTPAFAGVAKLASAHREQLDGGGYHRGVAAESLSRPMRVLAVADAYVAMTSDRPHRPALTAGATEIQLMQATARGRLCENAVNAVLAASGHDPVEVSALPRGLTEREAQVLVRVARGMTNKDVAAELAISARTVEHHVRHIYDKIETRTRAGAAIFAMEHELIGRWPVGSHD